MSKVYFVGAGPGDVELITIKGRRLLDEADLIIYAGSLVNPALLAGVRAEIIDSAPMTLEEITTAIIGAVKANRKVVRLHTGDTSFYSAITEQIDILKASGVDYEVVPGVSSALAAAAILGQELTVPQVSQTVIFTRLEGATPVPEKERLRDLASHNATMAIFLSAGMVESLREELLAGGYKPSTPVCVIYKATWPDQLIIRGTVDNMATSVSEANIKKTAIILVGDALMASESPQGKRSRLYDATFSHEYRERKS